MNRFPADFPQGVDLLAVFPERFPLVPLLGQTYAQLDWHRLQRPDLHYAPLDGAAGVLVTVAKLQGERSLGELAVIDIDSLDSIQHDDQLPALGRDLIGIPFAASLGHRRYLGEIDDGSGTIIRLWPLVIDIHLVGALRADVFGIGNANENAAVGGVIGPELGSDLEVLVGVLRDQMATLAL